MAHLNRTRILAAVMTVGLGLSVAACTKDDVEAAKNDAAAAASDAQDAAKKAGDEAKDGANKAANSAKEGANKATDAAKDATKDAEAAMKDGANAAKDAAKDAKDATTDAAKDAKDAATDAAKDAKDATTDAAKDAKDAAKDAKDATTNAAEKVEKEIDGVEMVEVSDVNGASLKVPAPIVEMYQSMGGTAGQLGKLEALNSKGDSYLARFSDDYMIAYSPETGAVTLNGMIGKTWLEQGGLDNKVGLPTAIELEKNDGNGWVQNFQKGDIEWVQDADGNWGAHVKTV